MLANLVSSLIKHGRVVTTIAKAKAARPLAEKMVTLAKEGTLHARRLVAARLHFHKPSRPMRKEEKKKWRQNEDVLRILFEEIAPRFKDRNGGYTRIIRLAHRRRGDAGEQAIFEWVEATTAPQATQSQPEEIKKS
jgi:large subunit ribosomal protein L17